MSIILIVTILVIILQTVHEIKLKFVHKNVSFNVLKSLYLIRTNTHTCIHNMFLVLLLLDTVLPLQSRLQQQQASASMSYTAATLGQPSPNDPLFGKIYILYVIPNDPISQQAWGMVRGFEKLLVQDATRINPRPEWLNVAPTILRIKDKAVFFKISSLSTDYLHT